MLESLIVWCCNLGGIYDPMAYAVASGMVVGGILLAILYVIVGLAWGVVIAGSSRSVFK